MSDKSSTVADVMRPAVTTVDRNDHLAAAAYLMKRAGSSALVILDDETNKPLGLVTEADIVHAIGDGKSVNNIRIYNLMTADPTVISANTTVRDAAETMLNGHFRHLPVVDDSGLIGMVDIVDVCRALLGS
jgi:CBS domain-containing protein